MKEFLAGPPCCALFQSFDLRIVTPLLAKSALRNWRRIAPSRPGSEWWCDSRNKSADRSYSSLPDHQWLSQSREARAPFVQRWTRPREGIQTKREMFSEL